MKRELTAFAALAVTLLAASCGPAPQTKASADTHYQPITAQDLAKANVPPAAMMPAGQHASVTVGEIATANQAPTADALYAPMTADELANANSGR